jgi:hypothetical protein
VTVQNFSRRRFLQLGGLALMGPLNFSTRELTLYVGTYTLGTPGKSEGIYIYRMDQMTGELKRAGSVKSENPSFLAIDPGKRFLYAVNEKPEGAVSAFRIDRKSGDLSFVNQQSSQGADPCHLSVESGGKSVLVANYTSGTLAVLPIQRGGSLGAAIDVKQHEGSGPREQQKGPHAHCIKLDRANRHAFAADLGIDKLMIYRFNASTRKLEPGQQASAFLHAGWSTPSCVSSERKLSLRHQRTRLVVDHVQIQRRSRHAHGLRIRFDSAARLHWNEFLRRYSRREVRPLSLRLEPRTQQHRRLCGRSTQRPA